MPYLNMCRHDHIMARATHPGLNLFYSNIENSSQCSWAVISREKGRSLVQVHFLKTSNDFHTLRFILHDCFHRET